MIVPRGHNNLERCRGATETRGKMIFLTRGFFGLGSACSDARKLSRREIRKVIPCHPTSLKLRRASNIAPMMVMRKIRREKKGAPIIARGLGLWVLMGWNNLAMRLF